MTGTARKVALNVLDRCFASGAWSVQTLDANIRSMDVREAALASRLAIGVMQNTALLDYYIDSFLNGNKKTDITVRNILRLGAYQILFTDKIPVSAAVNESVELCRKSGFTSACGLVNAVLRKIAAGPLKEPESIAVQYSHPEWFVEKMTALYGADFTKALLRADNEEPPTDRHPGFVEGETYVQDMAAYQSVAMAEPRPGMNVLDACSAPGGKAFTAAVMMKNTGRITACDIHEKKLSLIQSGAERLGIRIIDTLCQDASLFRPDFSEKFDLVIADVPCSGFGVIRKKPEIRFKTEKEIGRLPEIQKRIADNVAHYVKSGGIMLYSTCTVFPEENEMISHSITGFEIVKEKTFFPNVDGTDGFYACVLRKLS